MDLPANYAEKFNPAATSKTGTPRSERDELLDRFLSELNPPREKDGYPPLTHSRLARLLANAGFQEGDWHVLYMSCARAGSFSRLFWHLMKPKEV